MLVMNRVGRPVPSDRTNGDIQNLEAHSYVEIVLASERSRATKAAERWCQSYPQSDPFSPFALRSEPRAMGAAILLSKLL